MIGVVALADHEAVSLGLAVPTAGDVSNDLILAKLALEAHFGEDLADDPAGGRAVGSVHKVRGLTSTGEDVARGRLGEDL
jgi:hypothetical protein